MARTPLYSRSPGRQRGAPNGAARDGLADAPPASQGLAGDSPPSDAVPLPSSPSWRAWLRKHERLAWASAMVALALLAGWPAWTTTVKRALTIEQIDAALRESIAKEPLPSAQAAAYAAVLPSVVRVSGERTPTEEEAQQAARRARTGPPSKAGNKPSTEPPTPGKTAPGGKPGAPRAHGEAPEDDDDRPGRSVGTGVVIVDTGLILTNLHVVAGADKIKVTFWDGTESEAVVVSYQSKDDLAVLQAKTLPDDLHAATLRSTAGLAPGDQVVAVGFPFGIGPSASAGVVSGLKREFRSPEGKRTLTNLIQFDAAANPGNSGGPLVTLDGHVVGIVTAIMNPTSHHTFIGIGFAVPIENAAGAVGLSPF